MVVYVDILLFINTVVNYLIISLTSSVTHSKVKLWREVLSAFIGALYSLYIFLPQQHLLVEVLMRILSSATVVICCYGFGNLKRFLRNVGLFYAISFIYAGLMMGAWMLFKPRSMSIKNGVVYFDISPLVLITASLIFYIIIYIFKKLIQRDSEYAERCEITIKTSVSSAECVAMIDSGHSLTNIFGDGIIFIIDEVVAVKLFGGDDTARLLSLQPPAQVELSRSFRLIPVKTVSGEKLMPGIKVGSVIISCNAKSVTLTKPIAVITEGSLGNDYSAILPPEAMNN